MHDVCFEKQEENAGYAKQSQVGSHAPFDTQIEIDHIGWFRAGIRRINRLSGSQLGFVLWRYGTALLFVVVALTATSLIQRFFPYPFLFLFFAAVMASAWFGGTGAGLFAVVLSTIVVGYCFVPPFYSFAINATDGTYFAAFVICSFVASWVSSSKKQSEEALKDARDQLELRVALRTGELQSNRTPSLPRKGASTSSSDGGDTAKQIWSGTPEGSVDYCNQRLLDYAGRAVQDIKGEGFFDTIHPEDREDFRRSWQFSFADREFFRRGNARVRGADGRFRLFFTRGVPLRHAGGKVLRWYGTNTDIEEHKKAERALMRTQGRAGSSFKGHSRWAN